MSKTNLTEEEEIFAAAFELEGKEREAWLDTHCGANQELRSKVEHLLRSAAASQDYFESLSSRLGIDVLRQGRTKIYNAKAGQQFGQYRLTRLLGSGGMGEVWCAERTDGRFEGEVAVKLLMRDSQAALSRFDREAHYLARLTHPGIARLLDAGVGPDEVPYLILEYVEGEKIDSWCDAHSLRIRERLQIFLKVAEAVIHAHSRLVIHSDIKPSNVLVTENGNVKLLDFGIATLLGGDTDTLPGGLALTPEYASPEQINGDAISTATDVYSLGLLLCTLLTGRNARQFSDTTSMEKVRQEATRALPSLVSTIEQSTSSCELHTLARERGLRPAAFKKLLQGELDPVIRKALAVDPNERYATVTDFAEDIRRYLNEMPLSVMPQTISYQARKFVTRHRGSVLSTVVIALALVGAAVITTLQSIEARQQRDFAIKQQERVRATNDFLNILLGELGPEGKLPSLEALLDRGVSIVESKYGKNTPSTAMTFFELSVMYGRLGLLDKQLATLEQSLNVARAVGDDRMLASALCTRARLNIEHNPQVSEVALAEAREIKKRVPKPELSEITECYRAEALTFSVNGDHDAAIAVYRSAIDVMDAAPVASPVVRLQFLNDLSEQYYIIGKTAKTLEILEETIRYHDKLGLGTTLDHIIYLANRAAVLIRMGEVSRAAEQQADIMQRTQNMEQAPIGLGSHYAASLTRLGRFEEALVFLEKDYSAAESAGNERRRALAALQIGEVNLRLGNTENTRLYLDKALEVFSGSPGAYERELVKLALLQAEIKHQNGEITAAQADIEKLFEKLGFPDSLSGIGLSEVLWYATKFALSRGDTSNALNYADAQVKVVSEAARDPKFSADVGRALHQRGQARFANGDRERAIDDLQKALASLINGLGEGHAETSNVLALLKMYEYDNQ